MVEMRPADTGGYLASRAEKLNGAPKSALGPREGIGHFKIQPSFPSGSVYVFILQYTAVVFGRQANADVIDRADDRVIERANPHTIKI